MKIAVSYLKSKYNLEETIKRINKTNADYIHVDVMDGKFVQNKTYDYEELVDVLKKTNKPLDVHLMVKNPKEYILKYKDLKPEFITIHSEIKEDIPTLLDLIHSFGIKTGISIKPNTKVEVIEEYLDKVDNVLIMSVEPGLGGQEFMESVVKKIKSLNQTRNLFDLNYKISIDGGINDKTIHKTKGIDFVISGSFICMNDDYQQQINILKDSYIYNLKTPIIEKITIFSILTIISIFIIISLNYSINHICDDESFMCGLEALGPAFGLILTYPIMLLFIILLIIYIIKFISLKKQK